MLEKRTALHWAVERGSDTVVEILLKRKVDMSIADVWGNTPLHLAAWRGRTSIARVLLDRRADEDSLNHDGRTPLHLACLMGCLGVAEALRHGAAKMNGHDNFGRSASESAEDFERKRNKIYLYSEWPRTGPLARQEANGESEPKKTAEKVAERVVQLGAARKKEQQIDILAAETGLETDAVLEERLAWLKQLS